MLMRSTWLSLGLTFPRSVVLNILAKGGQIQTYNFVRELHEKNFDTSKKFTQSQTNKINTHKRPPIPFLR